MCPDLSMSSSMKPRQREEANTRDKIPDTCWVLVNKLIWLPAIHKNGSQHPIRGTQVPCKIVTHLKLNSTDTGTDSILKRHQIRNESPQDSKVTQQPQRQWQEEKMKHVSLVHINMAVRLIKCASYWVIWQRRHSWHTWYQPHNPAHCAQVKMLRLCAL